MMLAVDFDLYPLWRDLILLVVFGGVLPFVTGNVMLVVGLCKKKHGIWIAGLILLLIPVALFLRDVALGRIVYVPAP